MQTLPKRQIPTSDDEPSPLRPIPANSYQPARPEQLRHAETDHREPRLDIPATGRATTPVPEKLYIRMLHTVLGWVFVIGLFVWKYVLRTPFSDKARRRPGA